MASAISPTTGGDTSRGHHLRELGIAAVIGIQNPGLRRALDGLGVTVGSRGRVYRGLLRCMKSAAKWTWKPCPGQSQVGLVLADIGQALFLSRLRTCRTLKWACCAPKMLGVGVHRWKPSTTANWNASSKIVNWIPSCARPSANSLTLASSLDLRLANIGNITGFAEELKSSAKDDLRNPDEIMAVYRRMREVEKLLDEYTERAARFYDAETSADLAEPSASSWVTKPNCWLSVIPRSEGAPRRHRKSPIGSATPRSTRRCGNRRARSPLREDWAPAAREIARCVPSAIGTLIRAAATERPRPLRAEPVSGIGPVCDGLLRQAHRVPYHRLQNQRVPQLARQPLRRSRTT